MDKIALVLLVTCIVLWHLYTRARRSGASVEYELKHVAYKKEFDEAVGQQKIAKEEYEAALANYISMRSKFDTLLKSRGTESDSGGRKDPDGDA